MSTAKTHPLTLSTLLILLLALSSCATIQSDASWETSAPEPLDRIAAEPPRGTPPAVPGEDAFAARTITPSAATEELTLPEPEETVSLEVRELQALGAWEEGAPAEVVDEPETRYDFPVTVNKQVEFYLDFFQNKQRQTFARWLARSGRYLPLIQKHLREANLPLDLAYLPMIESGYSLTAYSRARAVGPWQFMAPTARHYGLTIDDYIDERRDPEKSTRAAVAYLAKLYNDFDCWLLAVAGYNAGEGKIRWAKRKANTNNFWKLSKHLHLETKRYVPKLMAAIIIAKDPEKYGFSQIEYDAPLAYETIEVPRWTALEAVAAAADINLEELRDLNRELRKALTPPSRPVYSLKVPAGKKELTASNLPRVRPILTTDYKTHVVRGKESLDQICRQYNLNKLTLLKANNLRNAELRGGQRLRIPFQTTRYKLLDDHELAGYRPGAVRQENLVLHRIKPGETVSLLAKRYNVPVHLIATWNNLENLHKIRAGQQLALYLESDPPLVASTGAAPESTKLASIPKHLTPPTGKIKRQPGSQNGASSPAHLTYYNVRGGDTLWEIAKRFDLTPEMIKRWNNLKDDVIHPGLRLLLKVATDLGG